MGNATSAESYIDSMINSRQKTLNSAMMTCVSENKNNVDLSQTLEGVVCTGDITQNISGVRITANTKLVGKCDSKSSQYGEATSDMTQSAEQTANAVSQSLQLTAGSDTTASNIFKGVMDLDQEIKNESVNRLENMNAFALSMEQTIKDSFGKRCSQDINKVRLDTKMESELSGFMDSVSKGANASTIKSTISQKASAKQSAAAMYAAAAMVLAIALAVTGPIAFGGAAAMKYIALGVLLVAIVGAVVFLVMWRASSKQYFNLIDVSAADGKMVKITKLGSNMQPAKAIATDDTKPLKFRLDASTKEGKLYVVDSSGKEVKLNGLFTISNNVADTDSHDKELPTVYLSEWASGDRHMVFKDSAGGASLGNTDLTATKDYLKICEDGLDKDAKDKSKTCEAKLIQDKDKVLGVQKVDKEDKFKFLDGVKTPMLLGGLGGGLALVIVVGIAISAMMRKSTPPAPVPQPNP